MTDIIIDLPKNFWRRGAACRTADLPIQQPTKFDQSEGREGAGARNSDNSARACRRGDRIKMLFTSVHEPAARCRDCLRVTVLPTL